MYPVSDKSFKKTWVNARIFPIKMAKKHKKTQKTRKNTIFGWNTKMQENPRFSPFDFGPKKCKKCSLIAPLVTCRGPEGVCTKVIFALAPASGRRGRAVWRV